MLKRIFDILLTLVALLALAPVFLIVALLIKHHLGAPVIFSQVRPGLNGKPFRMFKFRSMTDERDASGNLLPDEQRLPPFGKKLRSTSLDELPELINVLRGEMSIVGPRPLLLSYLPLYTHEQARRHEIRPGLTGWAQINGRNSISWDDKFKLDVWYVDHQSMWLDIRIIAATICAVFARKGISSESHATMPPFTGMS